MFNNLKMRFALIALIALVSGFLLYRNYAERGSVVTLGLDLQGGTYLALEIDDPAGTLPEAQRVDATDRALTVIRTRIDELGVAEPAIQKVGNDRIVVELPGARPEDQQRAREVMERTAFLQFQIVRPLAEFEGAIQRMDRAVLDAVGPEAAPVRPAQPGGVGGIFGEQEGATADTAAAGNPMTSRILPTGQTNGRGEQVGIFAVAEEDVATVQRYLALPQVQRLVPRGTELRWGHAPTAQAGQQAPPFRTLYLLEARPIITGERLQDAQAGRDPQFNQPIVTFEFNRAGGRTFERATGENLQQLMAIVLDDRVFSAPVIRSQIGARGQIELGGAAIEEARDLALVLRAGALPAPIRIIEERSVGPSLGQDSIDRGVVAGMIGISLVILTMLLYYRVAGVLAVAALSLYLLFVLAGLAGIGATLTLPGIAGLVLSIGMAVDANVLIFERIREELAVGRSPRMAVSEGFGHALSAIVDSNLTTLITAAILFQFGTGPIRGFAVTLAIGIIASMFTAIFITRTFFMLYLERRATAQTISI
jgi:protein-export membrane protein SecD